LSDRWALGSTEETVSASLELKFFSCSDNCRFLDNNNLTFVPQQLLDAQPELLDLFVAIYMESQSVFNHSLAFSLFSLICHQAIKLLQDSREQPDKISPIYIQCHQVQVCSFCC
jgi:hypothetical protein